MIKRCLTSLFATLIVCFLACSSASARVCFLPDSTDCGEGDVVSGSGNVVIPCKYKKAKDVPLNSAYQEPYKSGMCYYARCKISQSTCEANNGKNKKCCNFDSASGCYYMGDCPPEECPADYKYSSQQAADRESVNNCSCSPCPTDATKWKCTCPEKCENIKPVGTYAIECDESQIKEEATGIIGSDGQCYTCKNKPVGCTYEYRQATTEDSDGVTGDLDNSGKCKNGTRCWQNLWEITSLDINTGTPSVKPINKISSTSATCVDENNVTRYQTICQGKPKSKCLAYDGYEFKPNGCVSSGYNNGFEVKGDEWGDCVKKEETCFYEYTMLTTKDTGGVTDIGGQSLRYSENWDDKCYNEGSTTEKTYVCFGYGSSNGTYRCGGLSDGPECTNPGGRCKMKRKCQQYHNCPFYRSCGIADTPSVYSVYVGSHWDTPYNKISSASASCTTLAGVTKYQTICDGTPKSKCPSNKKFTPNNCVSSDYSNGVQVLGAEWGTCGCDTEQGYYDSMATCRSKANSGGCMASNIYGCYQTCKSRGYFSTLEDCRDTTYSVSCNKTDDCYERRMQGFLIKYDESSKRKVHCSRGGYSVEVKAFLMDVTKNKYSGLEEAGTYSTTIGGAKPADLPEDTSKGYQYTAGTYYLCYQKRCSSTGGAYQGCPGVSVKSVQLLKQSDYNDEFNYDMCFSADPNSAGTFGNKKCVAYDYPSNNYACKKITFAAGKTYKIRFDISYPTDSSTLCSLQ